MSDQSIIYIMGADFTGTTLLDFMLGSSENTSSLGEIAAFLQPTSSGHLKPRCSCGQECGIWNKENFINDPYDYLFSRHEVNTLIDSSKQIGWVNSQSQLARSKGCKVSVVTIWKDSDSYAISCANRGNPTCWAPKWINYYKALLQSGLPFYSVSLPSLLNNPEETLKGICEYTGISYKHTMKDYSRHGNHHAVFGSATARTKLHMEGSEEWKAEKECSIRADYHNKDMENPSPPTTKETKEIKLITSILQPNGPKEAKLLEGYRALWLSKFKKSIERSFYLLGLEPSQLIRKVRSSLNFINR